MIGWQFYAIVSYIIITKFTTSDVLYYIIIVRFACAHTIIHSLLWQQNACLLYEVMWMIFKTAEIMICMSISKWHKVKTIRFTWFCTYKTWRRKNSLSVSSFSFSCYYFLHTASSDLYDSMINSSKFVSLKYNIFECSNV